VVTTLQEALFELLWQGFKSVAGNRIVVAARKVGRGRTRTQAWVTSPKVPSEPSRRRSGPGPHPKRGNGVTP
jgi:hypothetical protein